jgi:2-oxoglutarate ferredoxin oxidoreductase subunit alpha
MNNWMAEPFDYPAKPISRGKVLSAEDLEKLGGFARYKDVDGDGVPYRTLPGTGHPKAGYTCRGTGHNENAVYSEREDDWSNNMDRLAHKFETLRSHVPKPSIALDPAARIGLICCGTSRWACEEARHQLASEYHVSSSLLRLKAYPFTADLASFIDRHDRIYVVDQNRDAQLLQLMRLELEPHRVAKLRSVRYYGGLPLDARTVTDDIVMQEGL